MYQLFRSAPGRAMAAWTVIDEALGYVPWEGATMLIHLIMGIPLVLALGIMLLKWPIPLSILTFMVGSLVLYFYLLCGGWIKGLPQAANRHWSKHRDRLTIGMIILKRLLYDSRLSRILDKKRNGIPCLPPEVWEIVLGFVVEVPFVFDTQSDAKTFYAFIQAHNCSATSYRTSYRNAEKRRKSLRLVCRMWAGLVDRPCPCWAIDRPLPVSRREIDYIKRLDLRAHDRRIRPRLANLFLEQQRDLLNPILIDPQKRFSITTVCVSINSTPGRNKVISSFLPYMHSLPRLRAVTFIDFNKDHSNMMLLGLHHPKFTSLTSLYIRAWRLYGSLRLERLETLYLDVSLYDADQWSFPSLRHFAMEQGNRGFLRAEGLSAHASGEDISPIAGPHTQLRSLFLLERGADVITIGESFWEAYPYLENLGISSKCLTSLASPLHDHPLNQITFIDTDIDYRRIMHLSSQIPNLCQIHLPAHTSRIPESDTTLTELFQECNRRGIRWLSEDGEVQFKRQVILERKRTSIEQYIWFLCSLYSYVAIYFHYCYGHWWEPLSFYHQGHVLFIIVSFTMWRMGLLVYDYYISPRYGWVARFH
jgi:hypothetical protein